MENLKVTLQDGLKIGEAVEKEVELRGLTARDVIQANSEAERAELVEIAGKAQVVVVRKPDPGHRPYPAPADRRGRHAQGADRHGGAGQAIRTRFQPSA